MYTSNILIVAEWSALTLSTDALTSMCDLDSMEESAEEVNVDEEQCPNTLTVTRACKITKIVIVEYILCFKIIMNFIFPFQCHYFIPLQRHTS